MTYFNEFDPFAAQWLRNLYPTATVDEKDIRDVQPADVAGFRRCHFFGGIGGWEEGLRIAGWPADRPVWSGSCPCQPLSCAGKRAGEKDKRHLWPELYRLISECRPGVIFGEQVDSKDGLEWLDGISLDLEELDYAVGPLDIPAAGLTAPQRRQRFFWVAYSGSERRERERLRLRGRESRQAGIEAIGNGEAGGLGVTSGDHVGRFSGIASRAKAESHCGGQVDGALRLMPGPTGDAGRLDDVTVSRQPRSDGTWESVRRPWTRCVALPCRDGSFRRVEPNSFPLAHGIPLRKSDPRLGWAIARLVELGHSPKAARGILREARANRVGRLKGFGNAIVPQVAAEFIRAFMECAP